MGGTGGDSTVKVHLSLFGKYRIVTRNHVSFTRFFFQTVYLPYEERNPERKITFSIRHFCRNVYFTHYTAFPSLGMSPRDSSHSSLGSCPRPEQDLHCRAKEAPRRPTCKGHCLSRSSTGYAVVLKLHLHRHKHTCLCVKSPQCTTTLPFTGLPCRTDVEVWLCTGAR